jgi:hypothetical protein
MAAFTPISYTYVPTALYYYNSKPYPRIISKQSSAFNRNQEIEPSVVPVAVARPLVVVAAGDGLLQKDGRDDESRIQGIACLG